MQYRQLGSSDLRISEISLGSLAHLRRRRRRHQRPCVPGPRLRPRHKLSRHLQHLRLWSGGIFSWPRAGRSRQKLLHTRDEAVLPDDSLQTAGCRRHRCTSRSMRRSRGSAPTMSTCINAIATIVTRRSRRRWRRSLVVVQQGKVRYLGFSEWEPENIQEALDIPNVEKFVSSQPQYSILWPLPEKEVFPLCAANGIGQIVWSPLAQGVLTGKYLPGKPPPPDSRAASPEMSEMFSDDLRQRRHAVSRAAAPADSRGDRPHTRADGAGVGAAHRQRLVGDCRGQSAEPARRQCWSSRGQIDTGDARRRAQDRREATRHASRCP